MRDMTRNMDRAFESDIEAVDISPYFKKPKTKSSGFTIKIISGTGQKPKVDVQTFGDVDKEAVQKQLQQLGYQQKVPVAQEQKKEQPTQKPLPPTNTTEEPATEVKRVDSRVAVMMELPGVKDEQDIQIQDGEESVEVRAVAGDKGYFKILTKPEDSSLVEKRFENGKLHLVFA